MWQRKLNTAHLSRRLSLILSVFAISCYVSCGVRLHAVFSHVRSPCCIAAFAQFIESTSSRIRLQRFQHQTLLPA